MGQKHSQAHLAPGFGRGVGLGAPTGSPTSPLGAGFQPAPGMPEAAAPAAVPIQPFGKGPMVPSEVYATWYGVQTDGPATAGVVTIDMWEANAAQIIQYLESNTNGIQYAGLLVHVEPPAAGVSDQGKPPNAYAYPWRVARVIDSIPPQFRVGFQATVESDSTWNLPDGPSPHQTAHYWATFNEYFGNDGFWGKNNPTTQMAPCKTKGQVQTPTGTCAPESLETYCEGKALPPTTRPYDIAKDGSAFCDSATLQYARAKQVIGETQGRVTSGSDCFCVDTMGSREHNGTDPSGALLMEGPSGSSHSDEVWGPSPSIGFPRPRDVQWFGGPGAAVRSVDSVTALGAPWQVPTDPAFQGIRACPDKALATGWPAGCPNNMYHLGWYAALINRCLRLMNSKQRVCMMNWDAEFNGPTGQACSIFQFLYALRQFGIEEDVLPGLNHSMTSRNQPWLLFQNGSPGMTVPSTSQPPAGPCAQWAQFPINGKTTGSAWKPIKIKGVNTLKDMAVFVPAPEYYWFNGEDMGNGGPQTPFSAPDVPVPTGRNGMMTSLVDAGFLGCPQSKSTKVGFDANCGCRNTVYETFKDSAPSDFGSSTPKPQTFLDLMKPLYDKYTAGSKGGKWAGVAPTFSIEHLGGTANMLNFGLCINSQNFATALNPDGSHVYDTACAQDDKCTARCGVANFFGNWQPKTFGAFVTWFLQQYAPSLQDSRGVARVCVYDMGFVPATWLSQDSPPNLRPRISAPLKTKWLTPAELNALATQQGIVDWMTYCPAVVPGGASDTHQYLCGESTGGSTAPTWTRAAAGTKGNPLPASLQCYDKKATPACSFVTGTAGGFGPDGRYFPRADACAAAHGGDSSSAGVDPFPAAGSGQGSWQSESTGSGSSTVVPPGYCPGSKTSAYQFYIGNDAYWSPKYPKPGQPIPNPSCPDNYTLTNGACVPTRIVDACKDVASDDPTGKPFDPFKVTYCSPQAAPGYVTNPIITGSSTCWCLDAVGSCSTDPQHTLAGAGAWGGRMMYGNIGGGSSALCHGEGCRGGSAGSAGHAHGGGSSNTGLIAGLCVLGVVVVVAAAVGGVFGVRRARRQGSGASGPTRSR